MQLRDWLSSECARRANAGRSFISARYQARPRNSFRVPTVCKRYRDKNREVQTVA